MYLKRLITNRLKSLSEAFPVIVISGARQVGKTTLLQHFLQDKDDYVVFDPLIDVESAKADPDLFFRNHKTPLVLDEIQYAPEVVSTLKRRVDENRKPGQYFLTGSQQWSVIKKLSESLAGRVVFLDLDTFALCEIYSIEQHKPWLPAWLENPQEFLSRNAGHLIPIQSEFEQIWRGFMPQAQTLDLSSITAFHQSYQRSYIERDIRYMAEVSDWMLFHRFVSLVGALTAQEINYSELGRELGVAPITAKAWLSLLMGTFQYFEIPPFFNNAIKKISEKPKGFYADTGAICYLQSVGSPMALAGNPLWGPIFETACVSELRKQVHAMTTAPHFYHWRCHSGAEVDIILHYNGVYYPIEIKGKTNPSRADTKSISAFRKAYPNLNIAPGLVLSPCQRIQQISDNDYAFPWNWAL